LEDAFGPTTEPMSTSSTGYFESRFCDRPKIVPTPIQCGGGAREPCSAVRRLLPFLLDFRRGTVEFRFGSELIAADEQHGLFARFDARSRAGVCRTGRARMTRGAARPPLTREQQALVQAAKDMVDVIARSIRARGGRALRRDELVAAGYLGLIQA